MDKLPEPVNLVEFYREIEAKRLSEENHNLISKHNLYVVKIGPMATAMAQNAVYYPPDGLRVRFATDFKSGSEQVCWQIRTIVDEILKQKDVLELTQDGRVLLNDKLVSLKQVSEAEEIFFDAEYVYRLLSSRASSFRIKEEFGRPEPF